MPHFYQVRGFRRLLTQFCSSYISFRFSEQS
jgi:hypothetical protein